MLTATVRRKNVISALFGFSVSMQQPVLEGLSYSKLMGALHKAGIEINRKVLADLAMNNPEAFRAIVLQAKNA